MEFKVQFATYTSYVRYEGEHDAFAKVNHAYICANIFI